MKKLGLSLIVISLICLIFIKIQSINDYKKELRTIDAVFKSGEPNKTNYIGYIEIESINLKKGIVKGINDKILNNNDIGMIRDSNIILAGHAVEKVFDNLNQINIEDKIKMYLYDQIYSYTVYKKVIVEKTNLDYLSEDLVLITCTNDDKRLLVLSKKDI